MKNKVILLAFFSFLLGAAYAQLANTGSNHCVIRIETDNKIYKFNTLAMSASSML